MEGKVVRAKDIALESGERVVGMGEGEEILPATEGLAGDGGKGEGPVFHEMESAEGVGQEDDHLFLGHLDRRAAREDGFVLIHQVVVGFAENFVMAVLPVLLESGEHLG